MPKIDASKLRVWARSKAAHSIAADDRTEQAGAPGLSRSVQERAAESLLKEGKDVPRFRKGQSVKVIFPMNGLKAGERGVVVNYTSEKDHRPVYEIRIGDNDTTKLVSMSALASA